MCSLAASNVHQSNHAGAGPLSHYNSRY